MTVYNSYSVLILLMFYSLFSMIIINKILKHSRPILGSISSSLSGPIALLLVNFASKFTGVFLSLNIINIGISFIAGVPGVCMMIILNIIFLS